MSGGILEAMQVQAAKVGDVVKTAQRRAMSAADKTASYASGSAALVLPLYLSGRVAPDARGMAAAAYTGLIGAAVVTLVGFTVPRYVPAAVVGAGLAVGVKAVIQLASQSPAPLPPLAGPLSGYLNLGTR